MAEKQVTEALVKKLIAEEIKVAIGGVEARFANMISEAIAALVKKEEVAGDLQKILDNLQNFVTTDVLENRLSNLVTRDMWNESLEAIFSTAAPLKGISPEMASETLMGPIPSDYLTGLFYCDADRTEVETEDNRRVVRNTRRIRALTPDDVLDWKDNGDTVTVVTRDGQKYVLDKTAGKAKE